MRNYVKEKNEFKKTADLDKTRTCGSWERLFLGNYYTGIHSASDYGIKFHYKYSASNGCSYNKIFNVADYSGPGYPYVTWNYF